MKIVNLVRITGTYQNCAYANYKLTCLEKANDKKTEDSETIYMTGFKTIELKIKVKNMTKNISDIIQAFLKGQIIEFKCLYDSYGNAVEFMKGE